MLVTVPSPASASDPASEIVVTATALPDAPGARAYSVDDIDRVRLEQATSGRLDEILAATAGVQQFRRSDSRSANPSAQGVTLRGLGGNATSRALVLLDGVPLADPMFGYIPFSAIPPEQLARVRVLRGGGSGPFGLGAVAGTIELESADPSLLGRLAWQALVSDRGAGETSLSFAPPLGAGYVVIAGRWDEGRGFWTTPEAQRVAASARARYESRSIALRAAVPVGADLSLGVRVAAFDDHRSLRFAGADNMSSGQDASIRLTGLGRWSFDAIGYLQLRDFSNIVISSSNFRKTLDQRETPATGIGAKFELRPPVGQTGMLRLGVDVRRTRGDLREDAYNAASGLVSARRGAGGTNGNAGLFGEIDWKVGRITLTGGLRADHYSMRGGYLTEASNAGAALLQRQFPDRSGWTASFRGGGLAKLRNGLSLRAAAYRGYRLPTLNELYRPFVVFPVTTRANAALSPERLDGFDLGLDIIAADRVRLSLTAFDNKLHRAIANVTIAPNLRERRNIDGIASRGVEISARYRLGALTFEGSATHVSARVRATGASATLDGRRPAQTPAWAASSTVGWASRTGVRLALTLRHLGAQFEDDLEIDRLPAATTLDAYGEIPLGGGLTLTLRGENLAGERVVTRNQAGSVDLGVPRTLWAGVRLKLP